MNFVESEKTRSAISDDMFALNYYYRDGYNGYRNFITFIDKEDQRGHRYGNLYEGYLEIFSFNFCLKEVELFQIKPQNPVYKIEDRKPDSKQTFPTTGYLNISGKEFVKLAKKAGLENKLPQDKAGNLLLENISFANEKEKYTLAKNIGLFNHYKTKPIKYEFIPNKPLANIFPLISDPAFKSICDLQAIPIPKDYEDFSQSERWDFFKQYGKTIVITEGHKKATSALSHGILAIASASITTHSKPKEEGQKSSPLKDDFKMFFDGRDDWQIEIIFDVADTKESTRRAVSKQSSLLSKKLSKYGKVFIRTWVDPDCKGLDDYLAKHGNLDGTYRTFPSVNPKQSTLNKRVLTADKIINTCYLSTDLITEARDKDKKLLFIKSTQNTGKTTIVKNEIFAYDIELKYRDITGAHVLYKNEKGVVIKHESEEKCLVHFYEQKTLSLLSINRQDLTLVSLQGRYPLRSNTLAITHRQTLATNLSNKLGLGHYQDSNRDGADGMVYCADSIQREHNLTDYTNGFIDEAVQVLWHLLDSKTEMKNCRLQKIERIADLGKNIIKNNGLIVLADADIDDNTVAFYGDLFGVNREECLVVENTYKPFCNRSLFRYKDCASWRQSLYDIIDDQQRVIIHTSGQKHDSTHGSYNLERDLVGRYPNLKIIRLDATTLGDEEHEAYLMLNRLKDLKKYDVIIASSSLNTGVDLTEAVIGKIDAVFGIYSGNYPLNDFEQSLERYRGDASRHVYLSSVSNHKIDIGSIESDKLYENIIGHSRIITTMYGLPEVKLANNIVSYYCNYASVINYEYNYLAELFYQRAEGKGYQLLLGEELTLADKRTVRNHFKEIKAQSTVEYGEKVVTAKEIDEVEAMRIQSKLNRTLKESLKLTKNNLQKRYCLTADEITPEIVEIDKDYAAMLHRYYLTVDPEVLKIKDKKTLRFLLENNPVLYPIDLNDKIKLPEIEAYKELRILPLIEAIKNLGSFSVLDIESYIEDLRNADHLAHVRDFVKQVLKIDVSKKTPATRLFSMILDRFGYNIKLIGSKRKGSQVVRKYQLISRIDEQFFADLLTRWESRDLKILQENSGDADILNMYNKKIAEVGF